jgi:hypothetical protein
VLQEDEASKVRDEITILDSRGARLTITARVRDYKFDTATYSDAPGFTPLGAVVGDFPGLGSALHAASTRKEVCILPRLERPPYRILITPAIKGLRPETRGEAERLMLDLFAASQTPDVSCRNLLVTHFAWVSRYPKPHVQGILDAIERLSRSSFQGLEVIGFEGMERNGRFERELDYFERRLGPSNVEVTRLEQRMPIDYLADFPVSRVWKGREYERTRILVLGESWYGTYEDDHLYDDTYVAAWLRGEVRDAMYSRMANAVRLSREGFWQSIAFTNYAQCVGPDRDHRPDLEMFEAGAVRLRAIIAELKPTVIWLLGKQQAEHSGPVVAEAGLPSVVSRHPVYASHAQTYEAWAKVLELAGLHADNPQDKREPGFKRSAPIESDAPDRDQSIRAFFEYYLVAWERRDIDTFLAMYDRPMLTLRFDGSLHCLREEAEFRTFFSAALDGYVATGYETADLSVDRIASAGRTAAVVDVTWTLRRAPNEVVKQFRQTYNVRTTPKGWKIYASTQHFDGPA